MSKTVPHYNFNVGDWVKTTHIAQQLHDPSRDKRGGKFRAYLPVALEAPIEGQIVGAVRAFNGLYHEGYSDPDMGDGPSLDEREGVLLWEVRTGMQNVPVRVLPENLERIQVHKLRRLPWRARVVRPAKEQAARA